MSFGGEAGINYNLLKAYQSGKLLLMLCDDDDDDD